jgi:hypothetical protein
MRIRIRKVPPSELEGLDLRPFAFREGSVYDVGVRLAEVLIFLGFAEPEDGQAERRRG